MAMKSNPSPSPGPPSDVISHLFSRPQLLDLGGRLGNYDHSLLCHADRWYKYLRNVDDDAHTIKVNHNEFVSGYIIGLGKDGDMDGNTGQPPSDNGNCVMLGFATESSRNYSGATALGDRMDLKNESISYLIRHTLRSALLEGGTPLEKFSTDAAADFFDQHITLMDWSLVCCRGTSDNESGNKWVEMENQLKARSEEMGLTGGDRIDFWSVLALINLGFHVAHNYARLQRPLNLLHACIRNVDMLHDNPTFEPLENELIKIYNVPHPEATCRFLTNSLVFTEEKLWRFAVHLVAWLQDLEGKLLPDGGTVVSVPTEAGELKYYLQRAGLADMTPEERAEELAVRNEILLKQRRKGGIKSGTNSFLEKKGIFNPGWRGSSAAYEAHVKGGVIGGTTIAQKKADAHELLGRFVEADVSMDDAIAMLEEGARELLLSYQYHIDTFREHFGVIMNLKQERNPDVVRDVGGSKVVILVPYKSLPHTYWYVVRSLLPAIDDTGLSKDWRIILSLQAGIDWSKYYNERTKKIEGDVAREIESTKKAAQDPDMAAWAKKMRKDGDNAESKSKSVREEIDGKISKFL